MEMARQIRLPPVEPLLRVPVAFIVDVVTNRSEAAVLLRIGELAAEFDYLLKYFMRWVEHQQHLGVDCRNAEEVPGSMAAALVPLVYQARVVNRHGVKVLQQKVTDCLLKLQRHMDAIQVFANQNASFAQELGLCGLKERAEQRQQLTEIETALVKRLATFLSGCDSFYDEEPLLPLPGANTAPRPSAAPASIAHKAMGEIPSRDSNSRGIACAGSISVADKPIAAAAEEQHATHESLVRRKRRVPTGGFDGGGGGGGGSDRSIHASVGSRRKADRGDALSLGNQTRQANSGEHNRSPKLKDQVRSGGSPAEFHENSGGSVGSTVSEALVDERELRQRKLPGGSDGDRSAVLCVAGRKILHHEQPTQQGRNYDDTDDDDEDEENASSEPPFLTSPLMNMGVDADAAQQRPGVAGAASNSDSSSTADSTPSSLPLSPAVTGLPATSMPLPFPTSSTRAPRAAVKGVATCASSDPRDRVRRKQEGNELPTGRTSPGFVSTAASSRERAGVEDNEGVGYGGCMAASDDLRTKVASPADELDFFRSFSPEATVFHNVHKPGVGIFGGQLNLRQTSLEEDKDDETSDTPGTQEEQQIDATLHRQDKELIHLKTRTRADSESSGDGSVLRASRLKHEIIRNSNDVFHLAGDAHTRDLYDAPHEARRGQQDAGDDEFKTSAKERGQELNDEASKALSAAGSWGVAGSQQSSCSVASGVDEAGRGDGTEAETESAPDLLRLGTGWLVSSQ